MNLTRDEVLQISRLARLELSEAELEEITAQLAQVIGYIDQLSQLDTDGVEPLVHPLEGTNVFAEDQVRPSLERSAALANAPHSDGECYLVPAVLGE